MSDRHGERDLTASIRELAATLERGLRDHPAPEELRSFVAGDLPVEREEQIEEHLALCRECARKAVELSEVPEIGTGRRGELLSEAEIDAQWKRFQAAVRPARRRQWVGKLAAVLLAAVVGFGGWSLLREMTQPRAVALVDLFPSDTERGLENVTSFSPPSWADWVALALSPNEVPGYSEYHVEIIGPGGRRVWSDRGIQPDEKDTFAVVVPRRCFSEEGAYRIRLSGPGGEPVGDFNLKIEPPKQQ